MGKYGKTSENHIIFNLCIVHCHVWLQEGIPFNPFHSLSFIDKIISNSIGSSPWFPMPWDPGSHSKKQKNHRGKSGIDQGRTGGVMFLLVGWCSENIFQPLSSIRIGGHESSYPGEKKNIAWLVSETRQIYEPPSTSYSISDIGSEMFRDSKFLISSSIWANYNSLTWIKAIKGDDFPY